MGFRIILQFRNQIKEDPRAASPLKNTKLYNNAEFDVNEIQY